MHGSFDKSGKPDSTIQSNWGVGFFALPVLVVIALVGLAMIHPTSNWISDAVQAEFVGVNSALEAAPVQLAQQTRQSGPSRPIEVRPLDARLQR